MENRKYYHYVFTAYKRRSALNGEIKGRLRKWFYDIAENKHFDIISLSILEDHVHMLVEQKNNDSTAYIMKAIKGGSSYRVFCNYPTIDRLVYRRLWARSYSCRKITETELRTVVKYIHNQTDRLGVDKRFKEIS